LFDAGFHTYLLDGDNVRHGLCKDLGFSLTDRDENLRRVGEVAKLMVDAGLVVLSAFISPTRAERDRVRALFPQGRFIEVHVSTPLSVCEARDPKGLYVKARSGEIKDFTGISSPYEAPQSAELTIDTSKGDLATQVQAMLAYLTAIEVIDAKKLKALA
jgi:adenylylsulfate kinase